jgi:hypothetical protein
VLATGLADLTSDPGEELSTGPACSDGTITGTGPHLAEPP